MNYEDFSKDIVRFIGGGGNVNKSWHCVTRLRFDIIDDSKVDIIAIKRMQGVMGARFHCGQLQIIIGNRVIEIFNEIIKQLKEVEENRDDSKKNFISNMLDIIAGIFLPILPAIVGASLLKGGLIFFNAMNWISEESNEYKLLYVIFDAPLYFLPILLAFSAARKFKTNEFIAATLACILIYSTLSGLVGSSSGEYFDIFGISIPVINYGYTVIPIILGVWLLGYIHRWVDRFIPVVLKMVLTPLLVLLISVPILLIIAGPLGNKIGLYLEHVLVMLFSVIGPLAGLLLGGMIPVLVITGMHYAFLPSVFANFKSLGYDFMLLPISFISNIAQAGATLAVAIKIKDRQMKSLAYSSSFSAFLGITEPAMYGVTLKLKKPFYAALIGGAVGGCIVGIFPAKIFAFSLPGLMSLPFYVQKDSHNLLFILFGIFSSFLVAFILTLLMKLESNVNSIMSANPYLSKAKKIKLLSPMTGKIEPLSSVPDDTFSEKIIGDGVAIIPTEGVVKAPFSGKVSMITPTGHAVGLISDQGVELLIHIGIETVGLQGMGFDLQVAEGQTVVAGDVLVNFDLEFLQENQIQLISPVIVTNSEEYGSITPAHKKWVVGGKSSLLTINQY
ncbi:MULTISPECIES: beta-glucoside-specific PTS transporter subunit IIABC [Photorhabdus]|uniref:PTS system beta-glucoside-specific IIA component (Glc family) /PTS system beta-glucoside-specific IIB component (Glc family) /PTS system beta-glucoside-specific IIC component (Glc family) n=2 Tax=Photorhabdus asymbiotica TaxID=291112 RepID=A0ABX9SKH8_9GAMM|nr:beta-glucoside-specific PTS transporter subunit IIABC [Photorhabdus asymbiotica]RKS58024.1 PTS system beta-glucoside-specific IIA component (Glc family) /PTS system beta-glucoside-specific IIB component (Glc family) /PTS system beta-glucoside-specific IIC component (Glc family) [Photorhabdus asymbiotica]CAQ82641.1 similar to beta-glucoside permease iiabc component [Photorhabdus asymbiotica]